MAYEKPILDITLPAAADYSAAAMQFRAMNINAAEAAVLAAVAGQSFIGILQNDPDIGQSAQVRVAGVAKCRAGGVIAAGGDVTVAADGELVASVLPSDFVCGKALEAAAVAGDIIAVLLQVNRDPEDAAFDGTYGSRSARATYDVTGGDSGAAAAHDLGVDLPDNAIITRSYYVVETTFTSAGADAGTLSLDINTDDVAGIVAATAISAGGNIFDAGSFDGIQDGTLATFSEQCTAVRALECTTAVQIITAGKLILFADYVIVD